MNISEIFDYKIGVFGLGAVVGGLIGSALTYILVVKKKEKELDEMIEKVNEDREKLEKDLSKTKEELDEAHEKSSEYWVKRQEGSNLALTLEEYKKLYSGGGEEAIKEHISGVVVDPAEMEHPEEESDEEIGLEDDVFHEDSEGLEGFSDESEDPGLVENPFEEDLKVANEERSSGKPPKIISEDDFEYDGRGIYDKEELYYYVYDDVLATEDEEEISNVDYLVGDALTRFNFKGNDDEFVCVRNFRMMTDYRVTKMFAAFDGLTPPPSVW